MPVLKINRYYAYGVRIMALPVEAQDCLKTMFTRLHEVFLTRETGLIILYINIEGENRLYILTYARGLDTLAEAYTALIEILDTLPGLRYAQLDGIDLEIILNHIKKLDQLKYCIIGPAVRLLDHCNRVLVILRPIDRTDLLNRMGLLERGLEMTVPSYRHQASTRSIELESRDHALVKLQHELSRLRKGITEGTWIGIVLTNAPPQIETREGDSILEPQGGLVRVLEVGKKVLDKVRKLELPNELAADPDLLYVPGPRYLTYLTSSDIADMLRCTVDKPGLAVNIVLPPKLSAQSREGELYLGKVLDLNFRPVADMFISLRDFCHIGVFGTTGSGKTVTAQRIAAEFVRAGGRVIVLDWKFEWRRLLRLSSRVTFYEVGYGVRHPLRWNPLRPPPGMDWRHWFSKVVTWFATTYALGPVQVNILRSHLWDLYLAKLERGEYPTMRDLYHEVRRGLEAVKGRSDIRDAYHRLLFRLWTYGEGPLSKVFDRDYNTTIMDLLQDSDVIDIECASIDDVDKPFLVGLIMFQLYYTCSVNRRPLTVPTLVVVEEAHRVVKSVSASKDADIILEDIWGEITAISRAYNLYLMFIIQTLRPLSPLVLSNLRILIVHSLQLPEDIEYVAKLLAGTDDPDRIARFVPYLPVGHALMKIVSYRTEEPRLVKVEPFTLRDVSDDEIDLLLRVQ